MLLVAIQTSDAMISILNKQTKNGAAAYIGKKNPIFLLIQGRAATDWMMSVKRADPASEENILKKAKMESWPEEKQKQYQVTVLKSLKDYTDQAHFDLDIFVMIFSDFGNKDLKKFVTETDFRVQWLGGNKYTAEFWEDGLAANSEANALVQAHELAKRYPDDKEMIKNVKETYANARKSIKNGKQERYTKVMALLYTKEKDGSIHFHDPGQVMFDFK